MELQEAVDRLRSRTHVPLFATEPWDPALAAALREASPEALFAGMEVKDAHIAAAAVAGLHLWNDDFSGSHNLCQGIQGPTGAYWHGLCHRREGHAGEGLASNLNNARHWFRQTGSHPAFDAVYRSALGVLDNAGTGFRWATEAAATLRSGHQWQPVLIVEWFAQADAGTLSPQTQATLEEIQWREIDLLVDWCVTQAVGE
jgi:hypothetical protein